MDGNVFLVGEKVTTLFLILVAGIIARKTGIIDLAATNKLSALLLNITQPLLVVTSFQIAFDSDKLKTGLMTLALSVAIHLFLAVFSFIIYMPEKNAGQKNIYEMATVFCNCGFLGYPVLMVVFGGEDGIFYGVFYTMFFNIFIWTYGVYLVAGRNKENNMKFPASKIFLNAGMISSVIGILFFIAGIRLPAVLYESSKLVGDMTFPLSMIIIGSLVSEVKPKDMFLRAKNYYYVFIKLIISPLVIALICFILKLPPTLIYIGTLLTAMPSAANVAVFAEKYGADSKTAAVVAGLSTLLSIGTIPLAIYFLTGVLGVAV